MYGESRHGRDARTRAEAPAEAGLRAAGRTEAAEPHVHLDLLRHGGPQAGRGRNHPAPPHREPQEPLAAQAAARVRAPRAGGGGRACGGRRASSRNSLVAVTRGRDLAEAAKLRTRRTSVEVHEDGAVRGGGPRQRDRSRRPARARPLRRARGRAARRRRRRPRADREGARGAREPSEGDWQPKVFRALGIEPTEARGYRAARPRSTTSQRCSRSSTRRSSSTTPARGSAPTPRTCTSSAWLRGDCGPFSGRRGRCSTTSGRKACGASSRGSAPYWGRCGTSTSCSSTCAPRWRSSPARRAAAGRRLVRTLEAEHGEARADMLEALDERAAISPCSTRSRSRPASRAPAGVQEIEPARDRRRRVPPSAQGRAPTFHPIYTDDELHRVRIKTKRARYAAELAEGAVGKKATHSSTGAKDLQDVIGEHQDAIVAEERIRSLLDSSAGLAPPSPAGCSSSGSGPGGGRAAWPRAWKKLERSGERVWASGEWPRWMRGETCREARTQEAVVSSQIRARPRTPLRGTSRLSGALVQFPDRPLQTRTVRAAGGVVTRRRGRGERGAARSPAQVRRLDVPEGQGRPGRDGRGLRAAGGGRGDRPALRARRGAREHVVRRRPRAPEGRPLLGDAAPRRPVHAARRGRRGALGSARGRGGLTQLRPRP